MNIKIKRLHPDAVIPKQATEHAGAWDVTATEVKTHPDGLVICKLGIAMEPPTGYRIMFAPRSSITNQNWIIQNTPAIGDADFRGEYQLRFRPISKYNPESHRDALIFPYSKGSRIGQMWIEKIIPIQFEEVEELSETERGVGGYGSTGV